MTSVHKCIWQSALSLNCKPENDAVGQCLNGVLSCISPAFLCLNHKSNPELQGLKLPNHLWGLSLSLTR